MRNLLLEKDKKTLQKEYFLRVALVSLSFSVFVIIIGIVFLLPSYFISVTKEKAIKNQTEITQASIDIREQSAQTTELLVTQEKLKLFSLDANKTLITNIFETVVVAKPKGVQLSRLFLSKHKEQEDDLIIEGIALNRETLLSFQKKLEQESFFETVELPISRFASDQDIVFEIQITGEF